MVEAVANHHQPLRVEPSNFDLVGAVHVADALAHEQSAPDKELAQVDVGYLQALGVADKLPEWRELASREANA